MEDLQHKEITEGEQHIIHNFKFNTIEERDLYVLLEEDINKICLVIEPYGFYALKDLMPTWKTLNTLTISVDDLEIYSKDEINNLLNGKINKYDIGTNEFKCGYTRNGKEVFGIEVDCGALPNNAIKLIAIPNYNTLYNYWIDTKNSYAGVNKTKIPMPHVSRTPLNSVSIALTEDKIQIATNVDHSTNTAKIVLNYTKE